MLFDRPMYAQRSPRKSHAEANHHANPTEINAMDKQLIIVDIVDTANFQSDLK